MAKGNPVLKRTAIYALCAAAWVIWMAFLFGVPVAMLVWLASMSDIFDAPAKAGLLMLGGFAFMAAWAGAIAGLGEYVAERYGEEAAFIMFLYHKHHELQPPALPPIPSRYDHG